MGGRLSLGLNLTCTFCQLFRLVLDFGRKQNKVIMRIALIKETKNPVDNRVALSPKQVAELNHRFPQHEIVVQASDIRAFSDEEYRAEGCKVVDDVKDCDILFGIKEAKMPGISFGD
jgi:hypothetical protein